MRAFFVVLVGVAAFWLAHPASSHAQTQIHRLHYQASVLNVVELGVANFEVVMTPVRFAVRAGVRTSGAARLFDQTEITATTAGSIVAGGALSWSRYDISHAYSGKFRRIALSRAGSAVAAQITPPYRDLGAPPASAAQQVASFDPLTALLSLGRRVGSARACVGDALVFDGRAHYRLALAARAQGNFRGGGYDGPALVCTLRYEPVSGFSAGRRPGNIPQAEIWFGLPANAAFAPPLRFSVQTPVGLARLEVRSYQTR
jgi:hypothetical protein